MNWIRSASVTVRFAVAKTEPSAISSQVRPRTSGSTSDDGTKGWVVVMSGLPRWCAGWSGPGFPGHPGSAAGGGASAPRRGRRGPPPRKSSASSGWSRSPGAGPGEVVDGRLPQPRVVLVGGVEREVVDDVAEAVPDCRTEPVGLGDDGEGREDLVVDEVAHLPPPLGVVGA